MAQLLLSYNREGSGPRLVLFHGGVGSRNHWQRNIPELARHFTVTAVDLPGFGASVDAPQDIDIYLSMVCDAAAELGGRSFGLAGFSFGAVVAAAVASRLGGMVEFLSMIAPGGLGVPKGRQLDIRPVPKDGLDSADGRAALRHNLAVTMFANPATADAGAVELHRSNIERARFDSRRISLQARLLDDLKVVRCPLQLIWGRRDAMAYPSIESRIDTIRAVRLDARVDLVADAGHWVQYERPEDTNRALLDFMLPVIATTRMAAR
jgi:2-hydroxy-6-oxonona-2,4-dienedioate hydrolase